VTLYPLILSEGSNAVPIGPETPETRMREEFTRKINVADHGRADSLSSSLLGPLTLRPPLTAV